MYKHMDYTAGDMTKHKDPNGKYVWRFIQDPILKSNWILATDLKIQADIATLRFGNATELGSSTGRLWHTELPTQRNMTPLFYGYKDQSIEENQGASGFEFPTVAVPQDITESSSGAESSNPIRYIESLGHAVSIPINMTVFGIEIRFRDTLQVGAMFKYVARRGNAEGAKIYQQEVYRDEELVSGTLKKIWFKPLEIKAGEVYWIHMYIKQPDEEYENAWMSALEDIPDRIWGNTIMRPIEHKEIALRADLGNIFITNITSAGNTVITYKAQPNEEVIESVKMANLTARVTVEWDRTQTYEGLPTINGVSITRTGKVGGNTYTGYADISGSYTDIKAITATGASHTVPLDALERPVITSASFHSGYPVGQSEVKAGDTFGIAIVCDTPYVTVETQEYEACSYSSYNQSGNINAIIADRGNVSVDRIARVRVKNSVGTWSLWFDTENTVKCNNLYPTITLDSKVYPNSQQALKDNEEVLITYSTNNANTVNKSVTGNLELTTNGCKRIGGSYGNETYTITAERTANGAVTNYNEGVMIAHAVVSLASNVPVQVRSGVGAVTLGCTFTQDLLVAFTNPTITATDSDNHSLTVIYESIQVTNLAGRVANLNRGYFIKGFAPKVLVADYPDEVIAIGTNIVTVNDVTVSGVINSTPPYDICTNRVSSGSIALVGDYVLNNTSVEIDKQLCAEFNYSNSVSITITIEEF